MPIYYNTDTPTPTTSNSINSVSINIRDFLLQKNLQPTYPSISTSINGSPSIGQPVLDTETNFLNFYPQQILEGDNSSLDLLGSVLNGQGIGIGAGGSLVPNFDVRASLAGRILGATGVISDTKIGTIGAQQLALALANNAAFNVEQKILGSLNIQENIFALAKGDELPGFRPNYKITVPNTTLGTIFNFATSVLGFTVPRSYLDPEGSIFQDESGFETENISRANSMLMNTGKGQRKALVKNMIANLSVNTGDKNYNFFRSGYAPAYARAERDDEDPKALVPDNLYAYDNGQGHFINLLSFDEGGVIPNLSIYREAKTESSGFKDMSETSLRDKRLPFGTIKTWVTNEPDAVNNEYVIGVPLNIDDEATKKSILFKTQKLFNSKGFKTLVSSQGDMNIDLESQLQTAVVGGGISKGNAVLRGSRFDYDGVEKDNLNIAANTYCRSWTSHDRYDQGYAMVRRRNLYTSEGKNPSDVMVPFRLHNTNNSVLEDNGMPKIAPYKDDKFNKADTKKFMFSIENLAWADNVENLPLQELGPGDLISGKRGRIMWFPPYDINFSEQNSVSWESTNFIGRGEPVYTYNNTERSGNLSFKIVVDHPSYANAFAGTKGPEDHYINSFWAGCVDPNKYFSDKLTVLEYGDLISVMPKPQVITPPKEPEPDSIYIYWPNDRTGLDDIVLECYEDGKKVCKGGVGDNIDWSVSPSGEDYGISGGYLGNYTSGSHMAGTPTATQQKYDDDTNFGLNYNGLGGIKPITDIGGLKFNGWFDRPNEFENAIIDFLKNKCPHCYVKVSGYASPHGKPDRNIALANDRRDKVLSDLRDKWGSQLGIFMNTSELNKRFRAGDAIPLTYGGNSDCKESDSVDSIGCKKDRRTEISFIFDKEWAASDIPKPVIKATDITQLKATIKNRFYNESNYFEKLKQYDYFVFDEFRKKIRFFHPAFHSTTPEGLNSRLTFLLQCTRQGATMESQDASNLAFGRPPVCILRIGDFYNTKIVMDNVSFDYEPLVWDLNPEGIGVQPMIANVTISFKFIGGSSLDGPLNKLQNALSFNYFANTQVYDPRADYIIVSEEIGKDTGGKSGKDNNTDMNRGVLVKGMENINESQTPVIDPNYQVVDNVDEVLSSAAANDGIVQQPIDEFNVLSNLIIDGWFFTSTDVNATPLIIDLGNIQIKNNNFDSTLPVGKEYIGKIFLKNQKTNQEILYGEITAVGLDKDFISIKDEFVGTIEVGYGEIVGIEFKNKDIPGIAEIRESKDYKYFIVSLEWQLDSGKNPKSKKITKVTDLL
jgi:hypothetical protein